MTPVLSFDVPPQARSSSKAEAAVSAAIHHNILLIITLYSRLYIQHIHMDEADRPSPESFDGNLSVISVRHSQTSMSELFDTYKALQSDSMVQIDHIGDPSTSKEPSALDGDGEDAKYQLVYSKSKVYVNPTAYSRDNIPGFVAIVKRVGEVFVMSEFL
jgi:hypothetical protein